MNQGTLSGTIAGEFKEIGAGDHKGIRFPVEVALNPKKPDEKETFQIVAYAANAEFLNKNAKKGHRINLEHRLGSDKVGEGQFDSVLVTSRVLGVLEDPSKGQDFANLIIGGSAKFRKFNTTSSGANVLNASVKIVKEFNGKQSQTYADVALWNKLAEDNAERAETEADVVVSGTPRPKVVSGKDGGPDQLKMDIWANSIQYAAAFNEGSPEESTSDSSDEAETAKPTGRQFRGSRTKQDDDISF